MLHALYVVNEFRIKWRNQKLAKLKDVLVIERGKEGIEQQMENAMSSLPKSKHHVESNNSHYQKLKDELKYVQERIDETVGVIESTIKHAELELNRSRVTADDLQRLLKDDILHTEKTKCEKLVKKYKRLVHSTREYLLIKAKHGSDEDASEAKRRMDGYTRSTDDEDDE